MKRKILYVIENTSFGGGERAFSQIINGLDKKEYEIYVASLPVGLFAEKIKTSVKLLSLDLRNRFNLLRIFQLAKIMKEKDIQIVHSQGGRADFFARIAAKMAKAPVAISTVAMSVEGYNVGLLRKLMYITLDRFSERFVDRFIVVSETLRKRLIRKHGIPAEKIVKIYNGVELDEFDGHSTDASSLRRELNIEPTAPLIGTVGRLVWQKGLPYLIQAIKIIHTRYRMQDLRYLIIGEGGERRNLELKIKNLGLSDRIILTGFRRDIKKILSMLDILVFPSIREGQGIVLLEAMAMGKPIVAANIEGVNETITDGATGILVPPRNSSALAEAIVSLLKDKKKAQEMGRKARLAVENKFNLKDKINQHKQLYEAIVVEK